MIWRNIYWLQRLSNACILFATLILLSAMLWKFINTAKFQLRKIVVISNTGTSRPLQYIDEMIIKSTIQPTKQRLLFTSFFRLNLKKIQELFLGMSWVRQVNLRKVWPDTLIIEIEEHAPVATWNKNPLHLVNNHGELFHIAKNSLQKLYKTFLVNFYDQHESKDSAQNAVEIMLRYNQLQKIFTSFLHPTALHFSKRDGLIASFDKDPRVFINKNHKSEQIIIKFGVDKFSAKDPRSLIKIRAQKFAASWPKLMPQLMQNQLLVKTVDLRYHNGFALNTIGEFIPSSASVGQKSTNIEMKQ